MPSVTLAEASKLTQNELISGVIESVVTVNPIYRFMPFQTIQGNAVGYNRENALAGVDSHSIGAGDTISATAKGAATFTAVTSSLKVLIGDAEVDHFIQTTMSPQNNQKAVQIASKAKSIGRKYQDMMITGDATGTPTQFDGLQVLVPASQKTTTTQAALSFEILDELISKVKAKDGQVDWFMMNDAHIRKYFTLLRALGGAGVNETMELPGSSAGQPVKIPTYRGIPIFRNDWIPVVDDTTDYASIYAGCWDDGSQKVGLAGLTSEVNTGVFVSEVGESESKNETITRVRFYCSLALFSQLAVARAEKVSV